MRRKKEVCVPSTTGPEKLKILSWRERFRKDLADMQDIYCELREFTKQRKGGKDVAGLNQFNSEVMGDFLGVLGYTDDADISLLEELESCGDAIFDALGSRGQYVKVYHPLVGQSKYHFIPCDRAKELHYSKCPCGAYIKELPVCPCCGRSASEAQPQEPIRTDIIIDPFLL